MKDKTKVLIGAALGGLLGVLFAPGKGSKTRKKIAKITKRLKKKFSKKKEASVEETVAQPNTVNEKKEE